MKVCVGTTPVEAACPTNQPFCKINPSNMNDICTSVWDGSNEKCGSKFACTDEGYFPGIAKLFVAIILLYLKFFRPCKLSYTSNLS